VQGARAVVLGNEVCELLREIDFLGEFHPVGDVAGDNFRALRRTHVVVWVFTLLVFHKVFRRRHLADVMVKRTDSRE
jgi:hypothetical protein